MSVLLKGFGVPAGLFVHLEIKEGQGGMSALSTGIAGHSGGHGMDGRGMKKNSWEIHGEDLRRMTCS